MFSVIKNNIQLNIYKITLVIALLSVMLCGCGLSDIEDNAKALYGELTGIEADNELTGSDNNSNISVFNTDGLEITATESVINMMEAEDDNEFKSASSLINDSQELLNTDINYYAYSMLGDSGKNIYNEIYAVLISMEDDIELSTTDKELIDQCFRCVMVDHPEIFYVTGYSISKFLLGDEIKKITFKGSYTMDKALVSTKNNLVEGYVNKCLSGVNNEWSDYEKIKYVYEYLIDNNTYELNSANNQNILSVVENGETVCQGYAKMTQLLLNRLGIFCTLVNGQAYSNIFKDGEGAIVNFDPDNDGWGAHVWNIVSSDGKYYNVDTTWGDSSFLYTDDDAGTYVDGPEINYDYLLVPDVLILKNHSPSPVVKMPICDSMDDYYYVREGLFFTSVDDHQLRTAFNTAYNKGEKYITLKCSDMNVYEKMKSFFFNEEKIFDYLSGTSVRYVEYEDRYALMIYL